MCDEFYHEPSEFEEAVESLKDDLRKAVKEEVQDELTRLREENIEFRQTFQNLEKLERATERAKRDYEFKMSQAKYEAKREVQQEGLQTLLKLLSEPKYRVRRSSKEGPKCDRCNENRRIPYTTPLGKRQLETCECAVTSLHYVVEEQIVCSVTRRNGRVMAWYESAQGAFDDNDRDYFRSSDYLKSPVDVLESDLLESPHDYGFDSQEEAQRIADKLNEADHDG